MSYFNESGRCIPGEGMRVFGPTPSHYYTLVQPELDYGRILGNAVAAGASFGNFGADQFKAAAGDLLQTIRSDANYAGLLNGVHVPFVLPKEEATHDLGEHLEQVLLPRVKGAFNAAFPESHFKAVLQSDSKLADHVTVAEGSRHEGLIDAARRGPVVGWYFPQAFQEFDVDSQRRQVQALPALKGAQSCLSGGMDVCAALTGVPGLLINELAYAPILCLSAYEHADPRMVLVLKSYGPHLEFWCMTQMLTKTMKQVSEQWAGGLTVFAEIR